MTARQSERDTTFSDFQVESHGLSTIARLEYAGDIDDFGEVITLAPGLGSPELAGLRHHLALLGHAAVSFEQPRMALGWQMADVGELRAGVLGEVMEQTERMHGIGRTALVCHSLAALDGATVGDRVGERLSSIEYMAGAGFSGDSFFSTARRLAGGLVTEIDPVNISMSVQGAYHMARNPAQYILEGIYGSSTDIRPKIAKQREDGLDVGALQFEKDVLFVPATVTARMADLAIRKSVTADTLHACHGSPLDDPAGTAKVLHDILVSRTPDAPLPHLQAA